MIFDHAKVYCFKPPPCPLSWAFLILLELSSTIYCKLNRLICCSSFLSQSTTSTSIDLNSQSKPSIILQIASKQHQSKKTKQTNFITKLISPFTNRKGGLLLNNVVGILGATAMGLSQLSESYELLIMGRYLIGVNCGKLYFFGGKAATTQQNFSLKLVLSQAWTLPWYRCTFLRFRHWLCAVD